MAPIYGAVVCARFSCASTGGSTPIRRAQKKSTNLKSKIRQLNISDHHTSSSKQANKQEGKSFATAAAGKAMLLIALCPPGAKGLDPRPRLLLSGESNFNAFATRPASVVSHALGRFKQSPKNFLREKIVCEREADLWRGGGNSRSKKENFWIFWKGENFLCKFRRNIKILEIKISGNFGAETLYIKAKSKSKNLKYPRNEFGYQKNINKFFRNDTKFLT